MFQIDRKTTYKQSKQIAWNIINYASIKVKPMVEDKFMFSNLYGFEIGNKYYYN